MSKITQKQIDSIKEEIEIIRNNSIKAVHEKAGIDTSVEVKPARIVKSLEKMAWRH